MKHEAGAWTPTLDGEAAALALAAAEAIARDLPTDPAAAASSIGLSHGLAGQALFLAYSELSRGATLGLPPGATEAGERAQQYLEKAIDLLAEHQRAGASLYGGFAGVAWVAEHLGEEQLMEDEDANAEIDGALLAILRRSPWRGEFDLLGGLVGWGVYALERLARPLAAMILPLVVARLVECGEREADGTVWRHPRGPSQGPEVGMAHGAAGVIALLARMLSEGAGSPEAAVLLTAAVNGVLSRPSQGEDTDADLAWCAGDAGLSVALLAAGRACDRDDWELAARRLATVAARRYAHDLGVLDPALCHGTAGLFLLFRRLYQATGDPLFLKAARRWIERTLARRRPGEGIGGFQSRGRLANGQFGWVTDAGFLGGAAGIGLALLASATPVEPAWDRVLLLSGRAQS